MQHQQKDKNERNMAALLPAATGNNHADGWLCPILNTGVHFVQHNFPR